MAVRSEPERGQATADRQQAQRSKSDAAFRSHLTVYVCVGLFLLTLNLLTSPGELWFYWPLFFWGWALVIQAAATYGTDAPARVLGILRSMVPGSTPVPSAPGRTAAETPFAASAFAAVHERIERLKAIAWQIPEGPGRDQAIRISATAERIIAVMAADRRDAATVTWFDTQLLEPTLSLLDHYARLSRRGVAAADETLRRVEEDNLPRLKSRFDTLYDHLHRGEIVDLAVASEMLDFDLPEPPPAESHVRT